MFGKFVQIACILVFHAAAFGQNNDSLARSEVRQFVQKLPEGTEIAVALVDKDGASFIGFRSAAAPLEVDNRSAGFEIGSLTKVFTSTILASLVVEEEVKLTDRVDKLLHMRFHGKASFTLEQLANHSSGLPRLPSNLFFEDGFDLKNPYKLYTNTDLFLYLKDEVELLSKPGKAFQYSNLGAGLLGTTLEAVSGKKYERLLEEYITGPLEMGKTGLNRLKFAETMVPGHDKTGKETPYWDFASMQAAGALISCTEDLTQFVQAQFSETETAIRLTHEPTLKVSDNVSAGLGWMIVQDGNTTYWFHNGATGGFSSCMLVDAVHEKGVVVLCSIGPEYFTDGNTDDLARSLMHYLQDEE